MKALPNSRFHSKRVWGTSDITQTTIVRRCRCRKTFRWTVARHHPGLYRIAPSIKFFGQPMWLAQLNAVLWAEPFIVPAPMIWCLVYLRQIFVRRCHERKKAPATEGQGKLSRGTEWSVRPYPLCTHWLGRTSLSRFAHVLGFVHLRQIIARRSQAPTGPGTKTFEIDQSFEPGARNRRPTAVGGSEDARSSMSDEFDSLDATEKAGIRATLIRCRVLAAKIANELRNKRPEHFVDKLSLSALLSSLEYAARLLEQKRP